MCCPAILLACHPSIALRAAVNSQRVVAVMDRSDLSKARSGGGEMPW